MVTFKTTYWEREMIGLPPEITIEDELEPLLKTLEENEKRKKFSQAKKTMDKIHKLLDTDQMIRYKTRHPEYENFRTLLATHFALASHSIRLQYKYMNFTGYITLLQNVHKRLFNQSLPIMKAREVVAEEMAKINLFPQILVDKYDRSEVQPPNRAFLDVLIRKNPLLAKDEILRREYSKLGIAQKRDDKREMREIIKTITEYEPDNNLLKELHLEE